MSFTQDRKAVHGLFWMVAFYMSIVLLFSGCAPLLVAGGAVGGYAVAKDMQDGHLIDDQKKR